MFQVYNLIILEKLLKSKIEYFFYQKSNTD